MERDGFELLVPRQSPAWSSREVRSSRGDICKPGCHLRMRTKSFAIIAVCAASSVGWQRTTRWMALRRELCVSRKGYSGQISLKPSFPGRLEPTAGSVSPILSKRSARSNSSSWISAIGVCRVNCRTFSAISRQCRAVILRSSLNGMSPRPKRATYVRRLRIIRYCNAGKQPRSPHFCDI